MSEQQTDYERGFIAGWRLAVEMAATKKQTPASRLRCVVCGMDMSGGAMGYVCGNLMCPNKARAL